MKKLSTWTLVVLSSIFAASVFAQSNPHVISTVSEAK